MSAFGEEAGISHRSLSALPTKADIRQRNRDVRFVPEAEVGNLKG